MTTIPLHLRSIRDYFFGSSEQHDRIFQSAVKFISEGDSLGIFVLGGTYMTGKSTLRHRIQDGWGLSEMGIDFLHPPFPPPNGYYIENTNPVFQTVEGHLRKITKNDLLPQIITDGMNAGIRTMTFGEIWAGHRQALTLIRDHVLRERGCRILIECTSAAAGKDFFDVEANNAFMQKELESIFRPDEMHLQILEFSKNRLMEALLSVSRYSMEGGFQQSVSIFSPAHRIELMAAHSNGDLEETLRSMLDLPFPGGVETK